VPDGADLDDLRAAAAPLPGCDLYRDATQVVFGSGPRDARVLMVGEQPGGVETGLGGTADPPGEPSRARTAAFAALVADLRVLASALD
jgi:hypothetical protein